jgi:hypothetical protein
MKAGAIRQILFPLIVVVRSIAPTCIGFASKASGLRWNCIAEIAS